jgi:hypothetical protein
MNPITKNQIITINTLLTQKGLQQDKAVIITGASGGRCSSTRELTCEEARRLIIFLNGKKTVENDDKGGRMRRHIIAMAHEMGWVKEVRVVSGSTGAIESKRDYQDIHRWVTKYGYLHKPFNDYTYNELPKLVTQFKEVYRSKMKL